MNENLMLLILSTTIFIGYVSWILSREGMIPSISESYYRLPYSLKVFFTLFIWGMAIPIMIVSATPLMITACCLICMVGTTQTFKIKLVGIIHTFAAMTGIGFGIISLLFEFRTPLTAITIIASAAILYGFDIKNKVFWTEIIAFSMILLSLFLTQV